MKTDRYVIGEVFIIYLVISLGEQFDSEIRIKL